MNLSHIRSSDPRYSTAEQRAQGIDETLLRLSVGLEAFEDLRDDLAAALEESK